jgi:hypothetical protein
VAELAPWRCLLLEEKSPDWVVPVAAPALAVATDQAADFLAKVQAQLKLVPVMVLMCRRMAAFHLIPALAVPAAGPAANR